MNSFSLYAVNVLFLMSSDTLPFPSLPVMKAAAAAEPLHDTCDFVKQFHQHGVPVSTSRTDAPWVAELHCEVGAPVFKLIKYALASAAPPTLEKKKIQNERPLARPKAGRVLEHCRRHIVENIHQHNNW